MTIAPLGDYQCSDPMGDNWGDVALTGYQYSNTGLLAPLPAGFGDLSAEAE